jgi:hypothetical protein
MLTLHYLSQDLSSPDEVLGERSQVLVNELGIDSLCCLDLPPLQSCSLRAQVQGVVEVR